MVEIDTVFSVRWCVMGTRLLINTAYGVDLVGSVNGTTSKLSRTG